MRLFAYLAVMLICAQIGCVTAPQTPVDPNAVTIENPVIKDLNSVENDFKKMQRSLVRLRVDNPKNESFGTGFFYRSRDMVVTSHHLFNESHPCMTKLNCQITIGVAKDAKEVTEQSVKVEVVLKYPHKDLIFLKILDAVNVTVEPLEKQSSSHDGPLTAVGFYQDKTELTFSRGKSLNKNSSAGNLTSIIVSGGFSGSPVVNKRGELVGVVSSFRPIKGQDIGLAQFITMDDIAN